MTTEQAFLARIVETIVAEDSLHAKKVKKNIGQLTDEHGDEFYKFLGLILQFCNKRNLAPEKVARDYLKMVNDMRVEGIYFKKHKKYSCENQHDAYLKVYSNKDIMDYYMNALLLSQVLWVHHFKMLMFFNGQLGQQFLENTMTVLDIG